MNPEFPKWLRIALIIEAAGLIFLGIVKIGFTTWYGELVSAATGYVANELFIGYARADGIMFSILAIFILLLVRINDWDKCKLYFGFLIVVNLMYVFTNAFAPGAPGWDFAIVFSIFSALYLYFYYQQTKKE